MTKGHKAMQHEFFRVIHRKIEVAEYNVDLSGTLFEQDEETDFSQISCTGNLVVTAKPQMWGVGI
jgi:hypothetical protein